jgi:hypothetical protein
LADHHARDMVVEPGIHHYTFDLMRCQRYLAHLPAAIIDPDSDGQHQPTGTARPLPGPTPDILFAPESGNPAPVTGIQGYAQAGSAESQPSQQITG